MKAFWHEAFNRDFHYDDVIKMKNGYYWADRELS